MKLYNRQNELLGDAAERAAVAAEWLNKAAYPGTTLTDAWKRFIYHQFHDDLTGTSIPHAYEFSWNDELISLKQFSGVLASSIRSIAGDMDTQVKGIPVILYNALGFPVQDIAEVELEVPAAPKGVTVYDNNGKKVASQLLSYTNGKAHLLIEATVPATLCTMYVLPARQIALLQQQVTHSRIPFIKSHWMKKGISPRFSTRRKTKSW